MMAWETEAERDQMAAGGMEQRGREQEGREQGGTAKGGNEQGGNGQGGSEQERSEQERSEQVRRKQWGRKQRENFPPLRVLGTHCLPLHAHPSILHPRRCPRRHCEAQCRQMSGGSRIEGFYVATALIAREMPIRPPALEVQSPVAWCVASSSVAMTSSYFHRVGGRDGEGLSYCLLPETPHCPMLLLSLKQRLEISKKSDVLKQVSGQGAASSAWQGCGPAMRQLVYPAGRPHACALSLRC